MKKALSVFLLAVILTSVLSVTAAKAFADDSDAVWDGREYVSGSFYRKLQI